MIILRKALAGFLVLGATVVAIQSGSLGVGALMVFVGLTSAWAAT